MRSVFFFSLAVSVASVFSQQPFVRYQEKLRRAVPHHYNHDEKNIDRGLDQVARRHQVEPHQPPLQPRQEVPWQRWVHEGRWAAQADKNTELHKVRAHLLAEKLKPNQFVFKPRVNPQLKPKLDRKVNARVKREVENGVKRETKNTNAETIKEERKEEHVRHKRDLSMIQPEPEINVQPELEAKSPNDQYDGRTRSKRQIVLFLPQPPPQQLMARSPRTTPNPFVRDTHVDDYDIIRPNRGEREGMIPSVEGGSGSDTLVSETSDLQYESGYTISMSDSEEWHNYPLTTPSGPNPGWRLSTLADTYQRRRRRRRQTDQEENAVRVKRSPKEPKRKIGAYKEKLKQRRKLKEIRRKRRIIRNSKEDKAVKEDLKDEKEIEKLLNRPRVFPRQMAYKEDASQEILWTNGTHTIVEDTAATVKWINETHYVVYRDQDNSTEDWYSKHHVLVVNEAWENMTSGEKRNATIGVEEETEEVVEEAKVAEKGKKAVKKKVEKRRKGKKGAKDKKAPIPKKKSKKSKKIMTVKNVNEAPKDPRRDPRERKESKERSESEEEVVKKKKKKVKTVDEKETSASGEKRKKKKVKKDNSKEGDESGKKKKRKKSKTDDVSEKSGSGEKIKKKKRKKIEDSDDGSDKKVKTDKDKKKIREKKEKKKKSDKSSEVDAKRKKKEKKTKDKAERSKEDKEETRRKRSIWQSSEEKLGEVRWEKVQKSEYDGWTVLGGDDKSQVYDASYELIETKNITKKHR